MKRVDLSFRRILFFWRNTPCVVIGRHQNPWAEVNLHMVQGRGVELARRRSGGGTVYHDLGNMNCTLFSARKDYDRPRNLQLVCDAVSRRWNICLQCNKKDDIICNNKWKVSGSSAKLLQDAAYHHFTLLLDVDMENLHQLLAPTNVCISESKGTASVPSKVVNLCSIDSTINYTDVCRAVGDRFFDIHGVVTNKQIVDINPMSESLFPGITEMKNDLQKWSWVYSKTPKFKVVNSKTFPFSAVNLTMEIQHGTIYRVTLEGDMGSGNKLIICNKLQGLCYKDTDVKMALNPLLSSSDKKIVSVCEWIINLFT